MVTYFLFGYLMNSIFSTNDSQLRVRSYFYEIPCQCSLFNIPTENFNSE